MSCRDAVTSQSTALSCRDAVCPFPLFLRPPTVHESRQPRASYVSVVRRTRPPTVHESRTANTSSTDVSVVRPADRARVAEAQRFVPGLHDLSTSPFSTSLGY